MPKAFRPIFLCLAMLLSVSAWSQDSTLSALRTRLAGFMRATEIMDIDSILEFTYPKVFEIAGKEEMREGLGSMLQNEEMGTRTDSMRITRLSPVFTFGPGRYAKIDFDFVIRLEFKQAKAEDSLGTKMIPMMESRFGKGKVWFNPARNIVSISSHSTMVGIFDKLTPQWCFLDFTNNPDMAKTLLDPALITKLQSYK